MLATKLSHAHMMIILAEVVENVQISTGSFLFWSNPENWWFSHIDIVVNIFGRLYLVEWLFRRMFTCRLVDLVPSNKTAPSGGQTLCSSPHRQWCWCLIEICWNLSKHVPKSFAVCMQSSIEKPLSIWDWSRQNTLWQNPWWFGIPDLTWRRAFVGQWKRVTTSGSCRPDWRPIHSDRLYASVPERDQQASDPGAWCSRLCHNQITDLVSTGLSKEKHHGSSDVDDIRNTEESYYLTAGCTRNPAVCQGTYFIWDLCIALVIDPK